MRGSGNLSRFRTSFQFYNNSDKLFVRSDDDYLFLIDIAYLLDGLFRGRRVSR